MQDGRRRLVVGAVISSNLETVKNFGLQLIHQPEITLQSRNTIQLKSAPKQDEDVVLLGDPFFSARLVDPTMSIKPDPAYHGGAALPNLEKVPIPKYNRTFGVSQELKLTLPFENLPAGRYLAELGGVVHTAWRSAPFAPSHPIPLDVRGPVAARKNKVYPWLFNVSGQAYRGPPNVRGEKIFPYALVDLELLFGRPETKILNVRVVLTGNWIGWSLNDPLPGVIIERDSQNTPHSPKAVVFVLKGLLGAEFTSTHVRLHLWAKEPLTAEQWVRAVPEPIAEEPSD